MQKALLCLLFLTFGIFGFAIKGIIIQSTDQALLDKWYKTLGATVPKVRFADSIFKNQELLIGIAITDYQLDKNQKSNVLYSVIIKDPLGDIFYEKKNAVALSEKIKNKEYTQLSEENIFLSFSSDDAFGNYEISVQIEDVISGEKIERSSQVRVLPMPAFDYFDLTTKYTFAEWMDQYKNAPEPERALNYFLLFTKSKQSESEATLIPVLAFFTEIFRENPFLFQEYARAYEKADDNGKKLLALLAYQSLGEEKFIRFSKSADLVQIVKSFGIEDIYQPLYSETQIKALWAEYDASAQQKPILHLVSMLSKEAKKASKPKTSPKNDLENTLYQKVVSSLHNHFKNDALALKYGNYILAFEKLTELQRDELSAILKQYND